MCGAGVPYCPWWGCWGKQGVRLFDEPLWAGGRSCSGHYLVVPALVDFNPDLRRGVVTVCRWGGRLSSGVRRPAARRAVSQAGAVACFQCSRSFVSAGWPLSAGARGRRMVPRRVTLVSVSCVEAWPHSTGGIQTARSATSSWRGKPTTSSPPPHTPSQPTNTTGTQQPSQQCPHHRKAPTIPSPPFTSINS